MSQCPACNAEHWEAYQLHHSELPLHKHAAELAVRQRDISFGPRSEVGQTAQQLNRGKSWAIP